MKIKLLLTMIFVVVFFVAMANIAVAMNQPTTTHKTINIQQDMPYVFSESDFSFSDPNDSPPDNFIKVRISLVPHEGDRFAASPFTYAGTILLGVNQAPEFVDVANINAGNLRFIPPQGYTGLVTFIFQVEDDGSKATTCGYSGVQPCWRSNNYRITFNMVPAPTTSTNNAPNAVDDSGSVTQGQEVIINILENDTDSNNDSLTITSITQPTNGAVSILSGTTQMISYRANANFIGTDPFTYTINDGNRGTDTGIVTVIVSPRNYLEIEEIEINGKTNGELLVLEDNEIEVKVRNTHTEDIDNVDVTVTIEDVDGSDIDEEEEIEINAGDTETVTFNFDLTKETVDEKSYTVTIEVVGTDDNGVRHTVTETKTVNVYRQNHEVVIKKASLDRSTLSCLATSANVFVSIENIGKSDENDIEIRVTSGSLDLDVRMTNIDLDDFNGRDPDYQTTVPVDFKDANPGTHDIRVEVFLDGDYEDSETFTLEIADCIQRTTGTKTVQGDLGLVQDIKQGLSARKESGSASDNNGSIRDSSAYIVVLSTLAVVIFIAIIMAFISTLGRRR